MPTKATHATRTETSDGAIVVYCTMGGGFFLHATNKHQDLLRGVSLDAHTLNTLIDQLTALAKTDHTHETSYRRKGA